VLHRFLGFWLLRRAFRLVTADDPRPLRERLTREAKRVLVAAALLVVAVVVVLVVSVA
jgi:flagellar biosynthesis/type III secretory pathway M-ring protein FliF/YscJ